LLHTGNVWVKPEQGQRTGSVKYRMVYWKIRKALAERGIVAGTRLVEVTSGSTGVALAYAGQLLGLKVELHAYSTMAIEKRTRILGYGAELVVHPVTTSVEELLDLVRLRLWKGGYWHLGQFDRSSTIAAYGDLGRELLAQLREQNASPDFLACPVGTGGLLQGLGAALKGEFPRLRIVAVEPAAGEAIEGTRNTELCRLTNDPFDARIPDEIVRVRRPSKRWTLGGVTLGESASAAVEMASRRERSSFVIVAPD
jgi:cysteine synthase